MQFGCVYLLYMLSSYCFIKYRIVYKDLLKKAGYKITQPRKSVIDFLIKQKKPVSAQYIFDNLKKDLDKVTVYRILDVFEKLGIVFQEHYKKQALYYLANEQHHHIICRQCGHTDCVPCYHNFEEIKNFQNVKHNLVLSGLCNKCKN